MHSLRFEVLPPSTSWSALGVEYPAGPLDPIEDPPAELVRLANHAHAAGILEVVGADPEAHGVESQEDSEYANAVARGEWIPAEYAADGRLIEGTERWSGPWHDDNVALHEHTKATLAAAALAATEAREAEEAEE